MPGFSQFWQSFVEAIYSLTWSTNKSNWIDKNRVIIRKLHLPRDLDRLVLTFQHKGSLHDRYLLHQCCHLRFHGAFFGSLWINTITEASISHEMNTLGTEEPIGTSFWSRAKQAHFTQSTHPCLAMFSRLRVEPKYQIHTGEGSGNVTQSCTRSGIAGRALAVFCPLWRLLSVSVYFLTKCYWKYSVVPFLAIHKCSGLNIPSSTRLLSWSVT